MLSENVGEPFQNEKNKIHTRLKCILKKCISLQVARGPDIAAKMFTWPRNISYLERSLTVLTKFKEYVRPFL